MAPQTTNLDGFTTPNMEMEVFNPANAWADVEHIFLSVARGGSGLIWQIGGELDSNDYHIRFKRGDEPWGEWALFDTPGEPNIAPTLTTLIPSSAEVGGADFTMRVRGTGFNASSVIVFNGGDEPTAFVSDTEVTTGVKPSLASAAATIPVLVRNGTKSSGPLDFTFTEPVEAPTRSKR